MLALPNLKYNNGRTTRKSSRVSAAQGAVHPTWTMLKAEPSHTYGSALQRSPPTPLRTSPKIHRKRVFLTDSMQQ
ncbi:hypothetical protein BD779DRAFT_292978 [Infundibulicybe gibba]|nr:hypothetical protein BD779DRAFT_292978 [Infundibulicybe gibba]